MPLYFITAVLYFWLPIAVLAPLLLPSLDPLSRRAFWLTLAVFYPLAAGMEYVYLYCDVWTFSEKIDPLLGLRFYGAPVEEFVWWFGAVPFAMLVYFAFCRLFPETPEDRARRVHGRRPRPVPPRERRREEENPLVRVR